jgi:hypothetical protein
MSREGFDQGATNSQFMNRDILAARSCFRHALGRVRIPIDHLQGLHAPECKKRRPFIPASVVPHSMQRHAMVNFGTAGELLTRFCVAAQLQPLQELKVCAWGNPQAPGRNAGGVPLDIPVRIAPKDRHASPNDTQAAHRHSSGLALA